MNDTHPDDHLFHQVPELNDHRLHPELPPATRTSELAIADDDSVDELPPPPVLRRDRRSLRPADDDAAPLSGTRATRLRLVLHHDTNEGILRNPRYRPNVDDGYDLARHVSNDTQRTQRRGLRSLIILDADSHGLRVSQETEEDVCFPLIREHVRVNGIDFDEIEEFIREERDEENRIKEVQLAFERSEINTVPVATGRQPLSLAVKYTPKHLLRKYFTNQLKSTELEEAALNQSLHVFDEKDDKKDTPPTVLNPELAHTMDLLVDHDAEVKFGGTRITEPHYGALPDRFSLFHSDREETIHSPDIPGLVGPGQSVAEVFKEGRGTWWLDCTCPTDAEMKALTKAFGIHPLTAEDIRMQETREKVELFRNYYFVCFHTFEPDKELAEYLEPINVYIVVFKEGVLLFHFSPVLHAALVRRRVRQLRDYVQVLADWLCYALIDDITDSFVPVINGIEFEADSIEDAVFVRDQDFAGMLRRIGELRRKVMTLMRLLSGKADVIKMFAKRCQDEANLAQYSTTPGVVSPTPHFGNPGVSFGPGPSSLTPGNPSFGPVPPQFGHTPIPTFHAGATAALPVPQSSASSSIPGPPGMAHPPPPPPPPPAGASSGTGTPPGGLAIPGPPTPPSGTDQLYVAQPRADIALYLGDIQDHLVTMFQNLMAYEKIFSRSHGNYLAQLSLESFYSNNRITEMFSKITLIGSILVPLHLVTGMFGMNVTVPGEQQGNLKWWFGILGVLIGIAVILGFFANMWLRLGTRDMPRFSGSSRRSMKSFKMRAKDAKSMLSFPNKWE